MQDGGVVTVGMISHDACKICLISSRQMTKKKSWTLQLNQLVKYMTSMFEKYEPTTLVSFSSYFHVVLEKK